MDHMTTANHMTMAHDMSTAKSGTTMALSLVTVYATSS